MLIAEKFIIDLVNKYKNHKILCDGENFVLNLVKLETRAQLHSSFEKMSERTIQQR